MFSRSLLTLLLSLVFFSHILSAKEDFIAGQVIYTESEVLPDNAKLEVVLEDISVMDVSAPVLGKSLLDPAGQIPIDFKVMFDDENITLGHRYAVRAKITHDNTLLYTTDTVNSVFIGNDNKHLNLMMKRVGKKPESRVMEGMYKYMADTATFKDCMTSKYYPVVLEEESSTLEKAYLNEMNGTSEFLKVELEGKIVKRAKTESSIPEDMLLVERFIRIVGKGDCKEQQVNVPITNNYWKLVSLYGKKVQLDADEYEAHILLRQGLNGAGALKVVTGCSIIAGTYKVEENTIKLRASAFEKKRESCKNRAVEKDFVAVLDAVRYWRIKGETLKLFDEMDILLATFNAVYF